MINDATSDNESSNQEGSWHLKYRQNLTPESILGEIWYGSHGLQLLGAPICVFKKDLKGFSRSCSVLD
jgi:hypothetical protein